MLILKMILMLLGVAFTAFGGFIFFGKKYNLINDFEAEYKAGRRDEAYARRVGLTEFIIGIGLLIAGVLLMILK